MAPGGVHVPGDDVSLALSPVQWLERWVSFRFGFGEMEGACGVTYGAVPNVFWKFGDRDGLVYKGDSDAESVVGG